MNTRDIFARGTGKTTRMIEEANAAAREGKSVRVIVPRYNDKMWLEDRFKLEPGVCISTVSEMFMQHGQHYDETLIDHAVIMGLVERHMGVT